MQSVLTMGEAATVTRMVSSYPYIPNIEHGKDRMQDKKQTVEVEEMRVF